MEFGSALNSEQQSMLAYIQKLGQIRKNYPAITRGHRENLSYGGGYWCYKLTGEGMQSIIVGLSRADGGDNSGCSLGGKYKLHNLLDESASDIEVDGLDLNSNRLNVYLVK